MSVATSCLPNNSPASLKDMSIIEAPQMLESEEKKPTTVKVLRCCPRMLNWSPILKWKCSASSCPTTISFGFSNILPEIQEMDSGRSSLLTPTITASLFCTKARQMMRGIAFVTPKIFLISSRYFKGMAAFLPNSSNVR